MAFREVDQLFEHMAVTAELEGDMYSGHEIQKLITEKALQKVAAVKEIADEQQTEPHSTEFEVLSASQESFFDFDGDCMRTFAGDIESTGIYQDKDKAYRVKADLEKSGYYVEIRLRRKD